MGMMLEPSIDEDLDVDDEFAEREDTHVMLSGEEMKAVVARANTSRHLQRKWMVSRSLPKIFITREILCTLLLDVSNFITTSTLYSGPSPAKNFVAFNVPTSNKANLSI